MKQKVEKFHQFVKVEKGPVNSAVIDLLKGNVFQVENGVISALNEGRCHDIPGFMESARQEDLIIEIDERCWLPTTGESRDTWYEDIIEREFNIELHVEEGVDLAFVLDKFRNHTIQKIVFYGAHIPHIPGLQTKITRKEKDFNRCIERCRVDGEFEQITESMYEFNRKYNPCWGEKVAVTRDGKVRPCIHSSISVGSIESTNSGTLLEKLNVLWTITTDKVQKCKACELRHVCFDCREIAYRQGGDLFAPHPTCSYDPFKGTWHDRCRIG